MPVTTSYQVTRYTYAMNAAHKITKLCLLFKHMLKDPLQGSSASQSVDAKTGKKLKKKKKTKRLPESIVPSSVHNNSSNNNDTNTSSVS